MHNKFLIAIALFLNKNHVKSNVICNYNGLNVSCHEICCQEISGKKSECCSSLSWNAGLLVVLIVPIFFCITSFIACLVYCYLIVKPTYARRIITPSIETASNSIKDLPPSYEVACNSEISKPFQINKSIDNSKKQNKTNRFFSPPPPEYTL